MGFFGVKMFKCIFDLFIVFIYLTIFSSSSIVIDNCQSDQLAAKEQTDIKFEFIFDLIIVIIYLSRQTVLLFSSLLIKKFYLHIAQMIKY